MCGEVVACVVRWLWVCGEVVVGGEVVVCVVRWLCVW